MRLLDVFSAETVCKFLFYRSLVFIFTTLMIWLFMLGKLIASAHFCFEYSPITAFPQSVSPS